VLGEFERSAPRSSSSTRACSFEEFPCTLQEITVRRLFRAQCMEASISSQIWGRPRESDSPTVRRVRFVGRAGSAGPLSRNTDPRTPCRPFPCRTGLPHHGPEHSLFVTRQHVEQVQPDTDSIRHGSRIRFPSALFYESGSGGQCGSKSLLVDIGHGGSVRCMDVGTSAGPE
jgi:hypothetical protein